MVELIFLSPQVKRSVIFSKKLVYTTSLRVALISLLLKIKEIKNYQENIILP